MNEKRKSRDDIVSACWNLKMKKQIESLMRSQRIIDLMRIEIESLERKRREFRL